MSVLSLETKLITPTNRPNLVPRQRLLALARNGLNKKLTLVSAPAGFGKTTLLVDSLSRLRINSCWISLDSGDNNPSSFLQYCILALRKISPGLGETSLLALQSTQQVDIDLILPLLLNEIAAVRLPFALVLDDYHVISDEEIHHTLQFLLEHQPPQMHLVIITRADPPWPLARLRVLGEIEEIRVKDLRFTEKETGSFLNDTMSLALSREDIWALGQRTEGWIAGLQLAALSLNGKQDRSHFIRAFSGSHRFVLDYLMEEVFEQIPVDLRDFLSRTSILSQLCGELCDFILERENSQAVLLELETKNLFLVPLDDRRTWYRYHPLFADLFVSRFVKEDPILADQLYRRASTWFEEQGAISLSIEYALAGQDFDRTAALIERHVAAIKDSSELAGLVERLEKLPEEVVLVRPWLCIAQGWVRAYLGQVERSHFLLDQAEKVLGDESAQHVRGHIGAIRCYLYLFDNQIAESIEQGRRALQQLPRSDSSTWISAATSLASALRVNGDLDAAHLILKEAIELSKSMQQPQTTVRLLCGLAALQISLGLLKQAEQTLVEAVRTGEWLDVHGIPRTLPAAGLAFTRLAYIHTLMSRLEEADDEIRTGITLNTQWGQANALWEGYRTLAFIRHSSGDRAGSEMARVEAARISERMTGERVKTVIRAEEARYSIKEGKIDAAEHWAEENGFRYDDRVDFANLEFYEIYADLLIAQKKYTEAQTLLQNIWVVAENKQATLQMLSCLVRITLIYNHLRQEKAAEKAVKKALGLASSTGCILELIEQGPPMLALLQKVSKRNKTDLVRSIIGAINARFPENAEQQSELELGWVETLSNRELEVLRLLHSDLPVPELAPHLNISASTLRTHIRNIYAKLGVHSRFEATTKGRMLGLI